MLEILQEYEIEFLLPYLRLVVETLCPLLVDEATDLSVFASNLPGLEGHLSAEVVHSLAGAAFERARLAGAKACSKDDEEKAEENAWRGMVEEGEFGRCVPPERQLDVLHALQVYWNEKAEPKGFLLRCFQNLFYFHLIDKATFFTWREEVDPNYPAKGHALFEVTRWLNWLETVEDEESEEDENENENDEAADVNNGINNNNNNDASTAVDACDSTIDGNAV